VRAYLGASDLDLLHSSDILVSARLVLLQAQGASLDRRQALKGRLGLGSSCAEETEDGGRGRGERRGRDRNVGGVGEGRLEEVVNLLVVDLGVCERAKQESQ